MSNEINVKGIIEKYLKDNGCDGLCLLEIECGCGIDDLMPCGEICADCKPAFRHSDGFFYLWKEGDKAESEDNSYED